MTVCSAHEITGLLHPATSLGFIAFLAAPRPTPSTPEGEAGAGPEARSPQRGSHPPKISPRRQPHRITAGVASLAVTVGPGSVPQPKPRRRPDPTQPKLRGSRAHPRPPKGLVLRTRRRYRHSFPMMLRSAEADPHVIGRQACPARRSAREPALRNSGRLRLHRSAGVTARVEPPLGLDAPSALPRPRLPARKRFVEVPGSRSRQAARSAASHPPGRVGAWVRRMPVRSGRLQGLAPSTSPLHRLAVASEAPLVPSMGFVPLQGPPRSVPIRLFQVDGTACATEPKPAVAGARAPFRVAANRAPPGCHRDPSPDSIPSHGRSRCVGAPPGGRSRVPPPRLFSAPAEPPMASPGASPGRSRAGRRDSAR